MVNKHALLDVSEIEQEIASQNDHSSHFQSVKRLLGNAHVRDSDATKLVMLYALRYQNHSNNDLTGLKNMLRKRGVSEQQLQAIANILEYAGAHARQSNLFNVESAVKITKRLFKGLSGVENVYTQHKPLLHDTLEELLKGRLKDNLYPVQGGQAPNGRPHEVVVFVVGGATYEESLTVHSFNRTYPGVKIVLGGTTVHNSRSFVDEVDYVMANVPKVHARHLRNYHRD